jgi:hypothetical protein
MGDCGDAAAAAGFSPDGRHLDSASGDGRVKPWDAKRLEEQPPARFIFRG